MVDSEMVEYSPDNFKKYIRAIMKNLEMPVLVPRYLKTKNICENAVQKFLFVIRYVSDWYKTQEMRDKLILENGVR